MTWQRMEKAILCAGRASVNASRMCSKMMACGRVKSLVSVHNAPWTCGVRLFRGQVRSISRTYIHFFPMTLASLVCSSTNSESQSRPLAVVVVVVIQHRISYCNTCGSYLGRTEGERHE